MTIANKRVPRCMRPRALAPHLVVLALIACITGCSTIALPPMPATCDDVTTLFAVEDALTDSTHPCYPWLDATQGRVAKSGSASAVIWSSRTEAGPALLVSAMHTLGVGWFDANEVNVVEEQLRDPADSIGVARIYLVEPTGGAPDSDVTPLFDFYNPRIPATENTNGFADILPIHDFYIGVVDDQKIEVDLVAPVPDELQNASPNVYDPDAHTTTPPTYASVAAGDLVLLMGYPKAAPFSSRQTANVGRVLSDIDAEKAITDLAKVGDVEGDIPYDANVEMIIMGYAMGGMSGGGVFDEDGVLVGIIVRASDERAGVQYVRAVRMTFMVNELIDAYNALEPQAQDAVRPYLEQDAL